MPREIFEFSCPCCGKRVELNTRTGKVRAVHFEESKHGKSLDDLVADQQREGERLQSEFDAARRDHEQTKDHFDRLYDEAERAAAEDKDKKPPHPFQDFD